MEKIYVKRRNVQITDLGGSRVRALGDDRQRWRWLKFYALSDTKTFPGLVGAVGDPLGSIGIIGAVYAEEEYCADIRAATEAWDKDIKKFIEVGLVKECRIGNHRYFWNVDFHVHQDYGSTRNKDKKLAFRYYTALEKLSIEEGAVFLILLGEFRPQEVELDVFGIPNVIRVLREVIVAKNGSRLLIGGGVDSARLKILMDPIVEKVKVFIDKGRHEEGVAGYAEFVDYFTKTKYKAMWGREYVFGARDGMLVKKLLKACGLEELKRLADLFFASKDKFVVKTGYSMGGFYSMINSLGKKGRDRGNFYISRGE